MKSTLRHTLPLLFSLCVLLGSAGIALSEQLCLMTGLKRVEALAHSGGCCESREAADEEDSCCTKQVTIAKLETITSQQAVAVALPVSFSVEAKPFFTGLLNYLATDQRLLTYSDSSPPLYGRRLLHHLQVLII